MAIDEANAIRRVVTEAGFALPPGRRDSFNLVFEARP